MAAAPAARPAAPAQATGAKVAAIIGGSVVALVIIGAALSSHGSTPPPAAATGAPPVASSATVQPASAAPPATKAAAKPAVAKAAVVAKFSGSGQENTARFTVSSTWKLSYSFNCSAFGGSGNFIVFEDGGNDFSGVSVNALAASKTGTSWAYSDAGTHYLEVDSECAWSMTVTDEG